MSAAHKILSGTLLTTLITLVLFPVFAQAAEVRTGDQPSLGAEERASEDLYITGGSVTSAGVVIADLIAAGGTILISGSVGGDLMAGGGTLTILGNVADDVRAGGGNIVVQGRIGGDAALAGGQLHIGGAGIAGDALVGGGTVRVDAPIAGDVKIGGGDVYLDSAIGGDVEIFAEKLTLGKNARITGDLTYTAAAEATIEEGAAVSGETVFKKKPQTISVTGAAKVLSLALLGTVLSQLAAALLFGLVFRRLMLTLIENAVAQPLLEVGRGLIFLIVLPVVSAVLFVTYIGIPLGILGFLIFAATLLSLWILTPVLLGSLAHRTFFKGEFDVNWKTILLGVVIYFILGLLPIVGWITQFILMLLTLGVVVKVKWEALKEWR